MTLELPSCVAWSTITIRWYLSWCRRGRVLVNYESVRQFIDWARLAKRALGWQVGPPNPNTQPAPCPPNPERRRKAKRNRFEAGGARSGLQQELQQVGELGRGEQFAEV